MTDRAPMEPLPRAAALALGFVMAEAVLGMALGAMLMFWDGSVEIWVRCRGRLALAATAPPSSRT